MEAVGVEPTSPALQAGACPRQLCLRVRAVSGVGEAGRPSAPPRRSGRLAPLVERHPLDVEVLAPRGARLSVVAEQQVLEADAEGPLLREEGHARLLGRAAALAGVARDAGRGQVLGRRAAVARA